MEGSRLTAVVLACWLAATPFLVVAEPGLVGATGAYAVASDSMEPAIQRGSVVIVSDVPASAVEPGDVLTYRGAESSAVTTTHRVVEVVERDGDPRFVVKGDANPRPDSEPVDPSQVVGRVTATVPLVGHVVLAVGAAGPLLALMIVPALVLAGDRTRRLLRADFSGAGEPAATDDQGTSDR
jgi:signal peptidase